MKELFCSPVRDIKLHACGCM